MDDIKTILVVNDHPAMQDLLRSFPKDRNWSLEIVPGQEEALQRLRERPYDLILTGFATSGEEDVELLRRLRAVRPHLKLIVLTNSDTRDAVLKSISAHAFSYFTGPFDTRNLTEMIERAVNEPAWDDGIEILTASREWISLRLKCHMLTAERIFQFMQEVRADLPEKERHDIGTAFREILLNAMEHGGKFNPEQTVEIQRIRTVRSIVYLIRDPGEGFSFSALPHAAVSNSEGDPFAHAVYREEQGIRPGGFGVLLAKGLVDELIYNKKGNEVLLIKQVS